MRRLLATALPQQQLLQCFPALLPKTKTTKPVYEDVNETVQKVGPRTQIVNDESGRASVVKEFLVKDPTELHCQVRQEAEHEHDGDEAQHQSSFARARVQEATLADTLYYGRGAAQLPSRLEWSILRSGRSWGTRL